MGTEEKPMVNATQLKDLFPKESAGKTKTEVKNEVDPELEPFIKREKIAKAKKAAIDAEILADQAE